ncbi:hypothetical protein [Bacillus wiedmannii]|uniref:hypothetical protein n=1 Tax=Bacillus wiedmannii TaxID=1890302 RepID=UPI003D1C2E94
MKKKDVHAKIKRIMQEMEMEENKNQYMFPVLEREGKEYLKYLSNNQTDGLLLHRFYKLKDKISMEIFGF